MTEPIRLPTPEQQAETGAHARAIARSMGYTGSSEFDRIVNQRDQAEREARSRNTEPEPPVYGLGR